MYKVTAYFRNKKIVRSFYELYDAIDFRDTIDAHYPLKVTFEKGRTMKEWVYECWTSVMDADKNPLRHIPNTNTRHMILQILAWMWCIVFSFYTGSFFVFGFSAIAHVIILGAIAITVGTFETAKRKPQIFGGYNGRGRGGEHE
tara:strand:- start:49 stop:480 length:432 start_codon:yes stop_codon:yes gene_type:complete